MWHVNVAFTFTHQNQSQDLFADCLVASLTQPLLQAKTFTELKVLNREVRVILHSSDTNGSRVYGELVYPEGNTAASLAATLLDAGMAKYIDWSARMLPVRPPAAIAAAAALKKAEMAAQVRVQALLLACLERHLLRSVAMSTFSVATAVWFGSGGSDLDP